MVDLLERKTSKLPVFLKNTIAFCLLHHSFAVVV